MITIENDPRTVDMFENDARFIDVTDSRRLPNRQFIRVSDGVSPFTRILVTVVDEASREKRKVMRFC